MQDYMLTYPMGKSNEEVEQLVSTWVQERELNIQMKGSLKKFKNSVHWHFKKGKEKGILELTYWQMKEKMWFSVHINRNAEWIEDEINDFSVLLKEKL